MQIAAIKQYLTKEEVISIRIYQAKDGSIRIKDFGTGFNGDEETDIEHKRN
ncbi:hypothetical protein [Lebetimonas sp. JH292]|uniref:hypothetical protein n=1 Tax=Lebetimonas sp. JH292 TaxID=990068 RepID=UPI0004BA8C3F|nr:hypothetical protein [Lebetimonas sp. JH292]